MSSQEGIYLSLLDSAQSAKPLTPETTDEAGGAVEWWRPQTPREQEQAYALAKADVIARLLYGETVVLPYNQIIDSYAWLRIASEFLTFKLAEEVKWPLFKFAYFAPSSPSRVNSDLVLSVAAEKFAQSTFKLSAWGDLPPSTRGKIARELEEARCGRRSILRLSLRSDYHGMLLGGLNRTISYFRAFEEHRGGPICYWVPPPEKPLDIWPRFLAAVRQDARLGKVLADEIEHWFKKNEKRSRERRSDLYDAIKALTRDPYHRQSLKSYVDYFYNQKVGYSVTGGRGVYVMTDHLRTTLLEEDIKRDQIASQIGAGTSLGKVAIEHVSLERPRGLQSLNWDTVRDVLQDGEFQQRVLELREILYSPWTQNEEWHRQVEDKITEHQEWLATQLRGSVISKLLKPRELRELPELQVLALLVRVARAGIVRYVMSLLPPQTPDLLRDALEFILTLISEQAASRVIENTAAGTIMRDLKAAITIPDELSSQRGDE